MQVGVFAAKTLAILAYYLDKRHRNICKNNLLLAFGSETSAETVKKISIGAYNNLFLSIIEFGRYALSSRDKLVNDVEFRNLESYEYAKKQGKGVLLLTGHFSSWEVMALGGSLLDPMTIVVRPLDNEPINRLLLKFRSVYGNDIIPKKNPLRKVLRTLKKGGLVGLLIDQNASEEEGAFVPFFGCPASTIRAPIEIALKTGAVALPTFIVRKSPGKFILDYGKPIEFIKTGNHEQDVIDGLTKFNKAFEAKIRENPEQWFWMHRRWKTRPPGDEKSIY